MKISEKFVWKPDTKLSTLQISASFAFIFTMGKSENIWFFKNQWLELNILCIVTTNGFALNHDKSICIIMVIAVAPILVY